MGKGDDPLLLQHPDPEHAVASGEDRLPQLVVDMTTRYGTGLSEAELRRDVLPREEVRLVASL
jgi:hypothetical protein